MNNMQRSYRRSFISAILLHIILFFLLAMGFQVTGKNFVFENTEVPNIISATVMSPLPPQPKTIPPTPPEPIKKATPPPQPQPIKPVPQPPKVVPVEQPKPVIPQKDTIALEAKKQKKIQQDQIEKQLLADLKKTQIQKKKEIKNLKQKAIEEAFANELKNLSKKKSVNSQQNLVAADHEQKAQGVIDKYKALVLQAVGRRWLIPSNVDKNLATQIVIYTAPGGMVLDAEIYKSSGNVALDNSAKAAVFKASPLPVPPDAEGFKFFKRFVLVFKPMYFQNGEFNPTAEG